MKARTFSTVVLVGVVALLVALDYMTPLYIMASLLCLTALWEFYKMAENKGIVTFKKTAMVFAVAMMVITYPPPRSYQNNFLDDGAFWGLIFNGLLLTFFTIGVLGFIALRTTKNNSLATAATTIFGFAYIPFLFSFLLLLVWLGKDGLLLATYLVAVTKSTDIGAYLVGSWIGKHKMSPQTSPKKTWEGFAGGVLMSLMVSLVFAYFLLPHLWWVHAAVLGLILSPVCVVGDLVESVIKRDTEIKDSGAFIPGIGGALDLIDSILFTAPVFFFYIAIKFFF